MSAPPSGRPVAKREIVGWAMFDFANSGYTTIIVTVAFSVYFRQVVVGGPRGDWLWGIGLFISNVLVLVSAPLIGAIADGSGRKKAALGVTWIACVLATALLYFAVPGDPVLPLTLFVLSNLAFAMGESLVAAFLPEISHSGNVGRVSGFGWGLGYFGGLACLLLVRPLIAPGFELENLSQLRLIGPVTAGFFFVAAIPTFIFLRERAPRVAQASLVDYARDGFRRLAETTRSLGHFRELVRYLATYFAYSCGLMTVIAFASIFAQSTLGFTGNELTMLFLVLQIASATGALTAGPLQDKLGSRRTLQVILVLWILVCVGGAAAQTKAFFWAVALAAGLGIGALMAVSRGVVGLLSPVSKSGEFFGFWGLATRAAYALGPLVFGTISAATGSQRVAVAVTTLFFLAGLAGLTRLDTDAGQAAAEAWGDAEATPAG